MLVFVDFLALAIGLTIELPLVFLGQVSVVGGHVFLFVVLEALLALFQVRGLPWRQLVVLHSVGDAVLLVLFALVYLIHPRMVGIVDPGAGASGV